MWSGDGTGWGNIRQWHDYVGMEKEQKLERIIFLKEKTILSEIITVKKDKIRI